MISKPAEVLTDAGLALDELLAQEQQLQDANHVDVSIQSTIRESMRHVRAQLLMALDGAVNTSKNLSRGQARLEAPSVFKLARQGGVSGVKGHSCHSPRRVTPDSLSRCRLEVVG